MRCITYRSFRRSHTYSRLISGYNAAHSKSLCISIGCGFGAMDSIGQLGRGANMGVVILLCKEGYLEKDMELFLWLRVDEIKSDRGRGMINQGTRP